ncbi:MAG: acyl-CoA desaturase, partial [Cyanobacteria bacterium J06632_3]
MDSNNGQSSAVFGRVYWSSTKSIWITLMLVGAIVGGYATFRWDALLLCMGTSLITLGVGSSVGIHRKLIHNSFQCPQWLENALVYLGVLTSTIGPYSAIEQHDMRDWAYRQPNCHSYFSHSENPLKDWFWQLHCDIQLTYPPIVRYEHRIAKNRFFHWLEQTRIVQQLPWVIAFYHLGGWSWVFWGIYVRISLCTNAQWLLQYVAHHWGARPRKAKGAFIQTGNLPFCGLLTFGEGWQNNHQAFPESARFSLDARTLDPGWWIIRGLQSVGLAWNVKRAKVHVSIPPVMPECKIVEAQPQAVQMSRTRQK